MGRRLLTVIVLFSLSACGGGGSGGGPDSAAPASGPPAPPAPPLRKYLVDATAPSGISFVVKYTVPSWGADLVVSSATYGGAAAGDCDADGDIDLFITYGDGKPNRLYVNLVDQGHPLQFQDVAAAAGVAETRTDGRGNDRHSGPIFADMDGDGDPDLFIGGLFGDPNKVYENLGDCVFRDVTTGSGLDNLLSRDTVSAAFGDYDLDGRLDLFLTHWGNLWEGSDESEHLFRNVSDENGIRFENVSAATGVTRLLAMDMAILGSDYTLTPTFARINDDPWTDIVIAADFGTARVLLNDPSSPGTFIDATNSAVRSIQYGMGSALGDIDFDGDLDWFVTSIFGKGDQFVTPTGNRLLRNPGGDFSQGGFENITDQARVANGRWGWGACFLDIDNDTYLDIYHTNGWPFAFLTDAYHVDRSRLFIAGEDGRYSERARLFGLDDPNDGRGVVCADFDHDGDVDILQLTNHEENSATLWENVSAASGNNFLRVRLVGLPPNTAAAGARIFATIGAKTQMREIMIGSNYTSQNPTVQIFGLGPSSIVDELRVEWPTRMPGPVQPPDSRRTLVPAGLVNETLVICHPDLNPAPPVCA